MKIYFGPAVGRSYEPDFISCVLKLLRSPNVMFRPQCNDALVSRSRSVALSMFLRSDADVFLSIDTDIVFSAEDAYRLCAAALERNSVMVGLYKTRSISHGFPSSLLPRNVTADSESSEPIPVHWGATGFMAVPRAIAQAICEKLPLTHAREEWAFWPAFMPFVGANDQGEDIYLSEDYAFCERAKRLGYAIEALPDIRLGHVGPYCYTFSDDPYRITRLDQDGIRYRVETRDAVALASGSS